MRYKFVNRRNRLAVAFLDVAGFFLWCLWHIFSPGKMISTKKVPRHVRKILLIRADYIGDVFLTTHTLKAIRNRFPGAEVTFLVSRKSRQVLDNNPHIDRIITYSPPWFFSTSLKNAWRDYIGALRRIRSESFDLAVDFRGDIRNIFLLTVLPEIPHRVSFSSSGGWFLLTCAARYNHGVHEAEYHTEIARSLGAFPREDALPEVYPDSRDRAFISAFLAGHHILPSERIAVIHPGARKELRLWPAQRYATVARALMERYGMRVVLTGARSELPVVNRVQDLLGGKAVVAAGEVNTLQQLTVLFERSILFVGVSSGPSHLAASVGLPSVLIFGPEMVSQWRPLGNRHVIIRHDFPCSPCNQRRACPIVEKNCIKSVSAREVMAGVESVLNLSGKS